MLSQLRCRLGPAGEESNINAGEKMKESLDRRQDRCFLRMNRAVIRSQKVQQIVYRGLIDASSHDTHIQTALLYVWVPTVILGLDSLVDSREMCSPLDINETWRRQSRGDPHGVFELVPKTTRKVSAGLK